MNDHKSESGFQYSITNLKPVEPVQKVTLTFPDGAKREYPKGTTGLDVAKAISPSLAKRTVAMVLNGVLADASVTATSPGTVAHRVALRRLRRALIRLRLLGGMYGQFSFETKKGPRTLAFERGTVTSVAGADVAVRATDGTTWTWVLTGSSVIREDGTRTKASALAAGEQVFAGGPVSGSTRDARLIVIRKTGTKPA